MGTKDYDAFIAVAADCAAAEAVVPSTAGTIAAIELALLEEAPYARTSDDLLFETQATRAGITAGERAAARTAFFAEPKPCLRASPLVKQSGWGLHHDAQGPVAAYAWERAEYRVCAARPDIKQVPGMRNERG